jgi:hypothetical protein
MPCGAGYMDYEDGGSLLHDVIPTKESSDCCDAKIYRPTSEWARCLECGKMCDVIESDEL